MVEIVSRREKLGAIEFDWLEAGARGKTIILFLHGFPDNARAWEHQLMHFGLSYFVLAPSVFGTLGGARVGNSMYKGKAYAEFLLNWLEHLNIEEDSHFILVGHDLGGAIAERLSVLLENKVRGVVYLNSLPAKLFLNRAGNFDQLRLSWYMGVFQIPGLGRYTPEKWKRWFLNFAYDLGEVDKEDPIRLEPTASLLGVEQYRQFWRERSPQPLGDLSTLFLFGVSDAFLVIPDRAEIRPYYPMAEIELLPGNHWVFRKHPLQVNNVLDRYFSKWRAI